MKLVDNLDELRKTIILNNLVPCTPIDDVKFFYGPVRDYIKHLRTLGLGDRVLMVFHDVTCLVPAESSTYIYLKGGVYVNE